MTHDQAAREPVASLTQQLGLIMSRRVSVAVGLWGEPGIGKTHASHAVLRELPCAHLSLHATASERAMVTALPRPKRLPVWAERQLERAAAGDPLEARSLANLIATILSGLAPFVLHLEDAHEANPERADMIRQLAEFVRTTRGVGVLATSRAALPEPFLNHRLEPLVRAASDALISDTLNAELPDEGLEYVFSRARGNPLYTLEFVRYLTRQGHFWNDTQRWRWRVPAGDYLPVTVEALILELTSSAGADPESRAALDARAILPNHLAPDHLEALWARAANTEPERLRVVRQNLERAGLLIGTDFAHPLFGEVIAAGLSPHTRRILARRVVQVDEHTDPELTAGFVGLADLDASEAIPLLRQAANQASQRGNETAAGRWLAMAAQHASEPERAALAFEASHLLGNRDIGLATRLAEQAHQAPDAPLEVSTWLAELLVHQGQAARAEEILRARPEEDHEKLLWWAQLVRVLARKDGGNPAAIALWRARPEFQSQARVPAALAVAGALGQLGESEEALRLIQSQLERTDISPKDRSTVMHDLAVMAYFSGDFGAVERHLLEAIAIERTIDHPYSLSETLRKLASIYVRLGRHAEAPQPIREATRIAAEAGHPRVYAICLGTLGTLEMQRGEFEDAETHFRERLEIMGRFGNAFYLFDAHADLALLYLEWQPPHGVSLALRHAQAALEWAQRAQRNVSTALAHLARSQIGVNDSGRALESAQSAVRNASNPEDTALAHLALGLALEATGRTAEATVTLETAARDYERLGMTYMAVRVGLELARLNRNPASALEFDAWFQAHGLRGGHHVARRLFPELAQPSAQPAPTQAEPRVRLGVLGPIILERDGRGVTTRARKRLEILAYLLETRIAGRAEASVLELVDALYPDLPEPEAKNSLKQQVYLIRSSLGPEGILSTPTGYALGAVSSDAEDFLRSGDSHLWRGAYLYSLGEGWRFEVRESLVLALRGQVESLIASDPAEAARLGLVLLEMEPFHASVLRLTVRALEAAGDTRTAERTFLASRARLLEVGETLPAALEAFAVSSD